MILFIYIQWFTKTNMKPVTACACVLALNIFAGVIFIAWNHSWLLTTGIVRLTQKPVILELAALAMFLLSLIIIAIYNQTLSQRHFYAVALISGLVMTAIGYLSMNWFFSPEMFLQELYDPWEQNINTNTVYPIEQAFKCCGFRNVREFDGDRCAASKSVPCMKAMRQPVTAAIRGDAAFILCQIAAQCFVLFALRQACLKREEKPHNKPHRQGL